jgi:hypothetical protein
MRFFVGDHCVISGVYVSDQEAPLVLAQWRQRARDTFVSDSVNATKIVEWLLDLKITENEALIQQIRDLNHGLEKLKGKIHDVERTLDDLLYKLYALNDDERMMVEADTGPRWKARITVPPDA